VVAKRNRFAIYAAAALTIGAVGVLSNPRQVTANPSPGSAPVNIVSPLPLPVSGTVSVSATSPLQVTGSVEVSNLPNPLPVSGNVAIAGTPTMRLVVNEAVEWTGSCQTTSDTGCGLPLADLYRVPFGKRLVIEYVSFLSSSLPPGVSAYAAIGTGSAANVSYIIPPSAFVGNGGVVVGGQVVHLYAEGGAFVFVNLNRVGLAPVNAIPSFYTMSFTGHLE
jgi:hypothetical protein